MDKAKTFKAQDQIEGKKTAENSAFANSQSKSTNWVNGETLCVIFKCLSYNNVKDRKWRQKKEFPCYQDGPYTNVWYNTEDVMTWIEQRKKGVQTPKC